MAPMEFAAEEAAIKESAELTLWVVQKWGASPMSGTLALKMVE